MQDLRNTSLKSFKDFFFNKLLINQTLSKIALFISHFSVSFYRKNVAPAQKREIIMQFRSANLYAGHGTFSCRKLTKAP